jgi:hypothetical protein
MPQQNLQAILKTIFWPSDRIKLDIENLWLIDLYDADDNHEEEWDDERMSSV